MKQRIITALVIALIFVPLIIFDVLAVTIAFQVITGLLVILAVYEMFNMFSQKHDFHLGVKIITLILTLLVFFVLGNLWDFSFIRPSEFKDGIAMGLLLVVILIFSIMVFVPDFEVKKLGEVLTIVLYVGFGFSSLVILKRFGSCFLVYVFLTIIITDVFAFLFGVKFGKHKIAPNISPKKSWEGAIAGTVFGTVIGSLFAIFYGKIFPAGSLLNINNLKWTIFDQTTSFLKNGDSGYVWKNALLLIFLTITLSIVGQIGDLVASKFKRTYEIKDFGNVFPGHGGVLDRFDSAIFGGMYLTLIILFMGLIFR